jgi:hypothetical protein
MTGESVGPDEALLAFESAVSGELGDLPLELRRLVSELLGTFFLVLVAAGARVVDAETRGGVSLTAQVVAPGLMVMAVIYFLGAVGGALHKTPRGRRRKRPARPWTTGNRVEVLVDGREYFRQHDVL